MLGPQFLVLLVIACTVVPTIAQTTPAACDPNTDSECKPKEGPQTRRRRYLQSGVAGPCTGFIFSDTCPLVPVLNPDLGEKNGLSVFARDWVEYTCCQIVKTPMRGIISAVWMWLQVCTKAMGMATDERFRVDSLWDWGVNVTTKIGGPLLNMKKFCPQELEGGQLTEWVVTTFFPVMELYNPYFKSYNSAANCNSTEKVPVADVGDVSVLYSRPLAGGAFGHLAMIIHEDQNLKLPPPHDTENFVSFSTVGNTVGTMITGTKATHVGFGHDLASVTVTVTIHNANVAAMRREWRKITENGQMFDLLDWNCARTVMEILHAGFPSCELPLEKLWTPERGLEFAKKVADTVNDDTDPQLPLEEVHAQQIQKESAAADAPDYFGVPVTTLVGSVLGSVGGTLLIAIVVASIVISHIKAKAHASLESGLASLLIGAVAHNSPMKKDPNNPNAIMPEEMVGNQMDTDKSGGTNHEEFLEWANTQNMPESQAELLWKDLNRNHDDEISRDEWTKFIDTRPNLKWLVQRLKSVAQRGPESRV